MQAKLPMKASFIYTDQYNVRVTKETKDDIRFLAGQGVEVSDLIRRVIEETVEKAKRQIGEIAS